jgi:hypothetical protein
MSKGATVGKAATNSQSVRSRSKGAASADGEIACDSGARSTAVNIYNSIAAPGTDTSSDVYCG